MPGSDMLARTAMGSTPEVCTISFPVTTSCETQAKGIGIFWKSIES